MTLILDASSSVSFNTPGTSTSLSHTIGTSMSNCGLFVGMSLRADAGTTAPNTITATYNSVSMTKAGEVTGSFGYCSVALFYIGKPASGAHNIAVSWSVGAIGAIYGISYYGVHHGIPIVSGSYATRTETFTNAQSISVPSINGAVALDVISRAMGGSSDTATVGAGQTQIMNGETSNSRRIGYAGSRESSTGGTTTMSWSWTSNYYFVGAGFSVNPMPSLTRVSVSPSLIF